MASIAGRLAAGAGRRLRTVLIGFASSAAIVFQAARTLGASQAQIASWMWALGLGMGVTCVGLSLHYRMPVVTAWSTPGAPLLISSGGGLPLSDAIGVFVVAALFGTTAVFSGAFERLIRRIPVRWPRRCWPACCCA